MVDELSKPKLEVVREDTKPSEKQKPIADATDLSSLWLDTELGDGLTETHTYKVPIGKPRDFFRVVPLPDYRRKTEIYTHKIEGQIEEQHFLIDKPMRGVIDEARPCTLVVCIYRDGSVRFWPLKLPKDGEKDNDAWVSARAAARSGMEKWVKLVWKRNAYQTRDALDGYAPDPDYKTLPSFDELVTAAWGEHGIVRDRNHPIVKNLFGAPPVKPDGGDDGLS
jgi:hypothetical protein